MRKITVLMLVLCAISGCRKYACEDRDALNYLSPFSKYKKTCSYYADQYTGAYFVTDTIYEVSTFGSAFDTSFYTIQIVGQSKNQVDLLGFLQCSMPITFNLDSNFIAYTKQDYCDRNLQVTFTFVGDTIYHNVWYSNNYSLIRRWGKSVRL